MSAASIAVDLGGRNLGPDREESPPSSERVLSAVSLPEPASELLLPEKDFIGKESPGLHKLE